MGAFAVLANGGMAEEGMELDASVRRGGMSAA